jgi:hypothetical protein
MPQTGLMIKGVEPSDGAGLLSDQLQREIAKGA